MTGGTQPAGARLASVFFVVVFAAVFVLTLVLALVAFPLGIFTVFFTSVTEGFGAGSLFSVFVWLGPIPVGLPFRLPAGALILFSLGVYLCLLVYSTTRGNPLRALSASIRQGTPSLLSSDLIVAFVSIGFLAFTATAIDAVVQASGVPVGGLSQSDFAIFVSANLSPLVEEFGFRVCIVGIAAVLLSLGRPWNAVIRVLWKPSYAYEGEQVKGEKSFMLDTVVAVSALVFGIAHVSSGSGWDIGKFPEAFYGGLVLGFLYVKYGLHTAILAHWGLDYLQTVFAFFGKGAYGIPVDSTPGYLLQQVATADLLMGIGPVSFLLVAFLGFERIRRSSTCVQAPHSSS